MTLNEWADKYNKSVGTKVFFHPNKSLYYHNDKGFFLYIINEEKMRFELHELCGDGRFLIKEAERIARENKCNIMSSLTRHNPKSVERLFKFKVTGYIVEKELNYDI